MLVIRFIQKRMKEGRRFDESLRPHNLLDVDRFAMDLADARAESRRPVQSHRSKALESIGRPEADKDKVQSAEQVMRGSAALQELLKLRDSL